jgi:hypothetical protein
MRFHCLACGEADDIVLRMGSTGLMTIQCTICRHVSFVQLCATCGNRLPNHYLGCPEKSEPRIWSA